MYFDIDGGLPNCGGWEYGGGALCPLGERAVTSTRTVVSSFFVVATVMAR